MSAPDPLVADYVVVGSGAGGGPLAVRLAESGHSVIVIEAGAPPVDDYTYSVPAFHAYASESRETAWEFFARHYDDDAQSQRDDKFQKPRDGVLYPRAGTVGGCTAHHAMITVYPNDSDWDAIAELTGDPSWAASQMRIYFERLERCGYQSSGHRLPKNAFLARAILATPLLRDRFTPTGHGFDGWLPTSMANPKLIVSDWALVRVVVKAIERELKQTLGRRLRLRERLSAFVDPNDQDSQRGSMLGAWLIPLAVGKGRRAGTREILTTERSGLQLLTDTLAAHLNFDADGRCVGVRCLRGSRLYKADPNASNDAGEPIDVIARREVIVAGGAFNTPQLLMLSGIGPADELRSHGIDVRVDAPGVGANLQDRYEVGVVTKMEKNFTLVTGGAFHPPQPGEPTDKYLTEWDGGTGPYTTNGAVLAVIAKSKPELTVPDLFLFGLPADFHGYYPGYCGDLELKPDHLTWAVLKAHTENRGGRVLLRSTDARDVPDIRFRYFEEGSDTAGADLDAVVAGVKLARNISAGLHKWGAVEQVPGASVSTDAQVRQWVHDNAWGHHACGTCAIGRDGDPNAVLDSKFRVRGVPGLRVVDASVFPRIPGYFIVTPIYMISEKAAVDILADADAPTESWPHAPAKTSG
jgi:choline dehydrogenase